jgi:hypothetical protein
MYVYHYMVWLQHFVCFKVNLRNANAELSLRNASMSVLWFIHGWRVRLREEHGYVQLTICPFHGARIYLCFTSSIHIHLEISGFDMIRHLALAAIVGEGGMVAVVRASFLY